MWGRNILKWRNALFLFIIFIINGGAVRLTSYSIWSLTEVPFPITGFHSPCLALFDLACKLRPKPMPQVPNRFIAYVHTSFMQKVFHISQWEWKPHIKHNCKLDDLRASFEIAEGHWSGHGWIAMFPITIRQGELLWQNRDDGFGEGNFKALFESIEAEEIAKGEYGKRVAAEWHTKGVKIFFGSTVFFR